MGCFRVRTKGGGGGNPVTAASGGTLLSGGGARQGRVGVREIERHVEGEGSRAGGPGHGTRLSWVPRTRARAVRRRQLGDGGTGSRAGDAGLEREKGEGRETDEWG
jgi:hypothetical protein